MSERLQDVFDCARGTGGPRWQPAYIYTDKHRRIIPYHPLKGYPNVEARPMTLHGMLLSWSCDALVYIVDVGRLLSRETSAHKIATSATASSSPHVQPDAAIEPLLLPPYRRCCAGDCGYAFLDACRRLLHAVTQGPRARPALPSALPQPPVESDGAPLVPSLRDMTHTRAESLIINPSKHEIGERRLLDAITDASLPPWRTVADKTARPTKSLSTGESH